jgi:hypothetical protein
MIAIAKILKIAIIASLGSRVHRFRVPRFGVLDHTSTLRIENRRTLNRWAENRGTLEPGNSGTLELGNHEDQKP